MKMQHASILTLFAAYLICNAVVAQGWIDVTPSGVSQLQLSFGGSRNAVYDELRGKTVYFGFLTGVFRTYLYDGASWTNPTTPTRPAQQPGIAYSDGYYDTNLQRVAFLDNQLQEWSFDGIDWQVRGGPLSGYPAATAMPAAFDRAQAKAIIVNGTTVTTWDSALNITTSATPPVSHSAPPSSLFYDFLAGRVAMLNGVYYYEWSGATWVQRFPRLPSTTTPTVIASSPVGGAMWYGYEITNTAITPHFARIASGQVSETFLTSYPSIRVDPIVWDTQRNRFVLIGSLGDVWEYAPGPVATSSNFGSGCPGSRGTPSLAPQPGSSPRVGTSYTVQALNLPIVGPVFLFLGFSNTQYGSTTLPLSLAAFGAPACNLLVDVDQIIGTSNILGSAFWQFPVPPLPGVHFYTQAVVFDQPANPLGITLSNGLHGTIGS